MAAVKAGVGREVAHEAIKEHAVSAALGMREGRANNVLEALAADTRIPFDLAQLKALIGDPLDFTGDAHSQVSQVCSRIEEIARKFPTAAALKPGAIR